MPSKYRSERLVIITLISAIMLLLAFTVMQPTQHVFAEVEHSSSFSRPSFSTSSLLSIDRVANPSYSRNMMSSSSFMKNASGANSTLTIVTISNNGSFLPNTTYSVSPYPASSNITKLTITDDGPEDANKVTRGIISIPRLRYGSYLVTELKAPEGYVVDNVSKIIQIGANQSSTSATFTSDLENQDQENSSQIKTLHIQQNSNAGQ